MNFKNKNTSTYNKYPSIELKGLADHHYEGWQAILEKINHHKNELQKEHLIIGIECYTGVLLDEIKENFFAINADQIYFASHYFKTETAIDALVYPDVTDDQVFGYLTRLHIIDFFDLERLAFIKQEISEKNGITIIIGTGAFLLAMPDILIYADMPRWEGQLRFRRNEVSNLGVNNHLFKASLQYKRAYFVDWRVCDRLKKQVYTNCDYFLETVNPGLPKMITAKAMTEGFREAISRPFRVVPFFDPGPWGGQWMKEVCGLDPRQENYAWCFDCVPEENSLIFSFDDRTFELPALNLVFAHPSQLSGEAVHARFGDEFPIRFDFLDTMDGGSLSLQVHPATEYIQEHFGMHYTQDESYYILDAKEDAVVYLGLKEDINSGKLIDELKEAQHTKLFEAEKHVNKWSAKKHDHFLIPAGTIHCSGKNCMVLEISATPYIFTFKLWDWGRVGLDGLPRPINIEHGKQNIRWERTTQWVEKNLVNNTKQIATGEGWVEERTGLHQSQFIETRRHWFTGKVSHNTNGGVNVLCLVAGNEVVVESPDNAFEPFVVRYAETFIVPAAVGKYSIKPNAPLRENEKYATMKAFVR